MSAASSNRLIHEKSPYLLQHAHNPVDWYPWGQEAFAKAKDEHKPIFLSIGYSTCHWCHVMEHESFENAEIAELMNRWFVCIKVDREEHPDLDHVYMSAVTALTGQGGWPLTVFLTPDLKPFFGGTYFPPERRWNVPGMREVLPAIADAWRTKQHEILTSAEQLTQTLNQALTAEAARSTVTLDGLHTAFNQAAAAFDPSHGGFGDAPKFPRSPELSFLLHYWSRTRTAQALDMAATTLEHLARGGIHDHLGGGFHRYSTDGRWLVPHFEKMLYDQALLARAYLEAYQVTHRETFAETARDIFTYVLRDLVDPQGGFYSAEDADSDGEEGKFYVWTPSEITHVLGQEDAEVFNRFYGVTADGNFSAEGARQPLVEGGGQGPASGGEPHASILNIEQPLEDFAKLKGLDAATLAQRLARGRLRLLAARDQRIRPHRDDKILTSWNGLIIASLAYGASALDEPRYLEAARRAADFVLHSLVRDGMLLRRFRDGDARYPGTLEDYAFFSYGLLELYEASGDPYDLAEAKRWAGHMLDRFWDNEGGGFFLRSHDEAPLIVRSKELYDGATLSGNSIATLVLLRLGRLTADQTLEARGRQALEAFAASVERAPFGYPQMLIAWDFSLGPVQEIVIAGNREDPRTTQMLQAIAHRFLPRTVTAFHPSGPDGAAVEALVPYTKGQGPIDGSPAAYVCERFVCQLPTTDLARLTAWLDRPDQAGPESTRTP